MPGYVDLKLLKEIERIEGYVEVPRNQNLETFGLYLAGEKDVRTCYKLPMPGFECNWSKIAERS